MKLDKRLMLIGVMVVVLSMITATQYATTYIDYSFAIVHPSNADIRFIGSDNTSDDLVRVLRVINNDSGSQFLTAELGEFPVGSWRNYTAAFGIVNEENFSVNISHINLTGTNTDMLTFWLHYDRDADYTGDAANQQVKVVDHGTTLYDVTDEVWTLGPGDGDTSTMSMDGSTQLTTPWDNLGHVRYSRNDANNSVNETSDFVWVGINLDIPEDASISDDVNGTIYVNFKATTDN